MLIRTANPNDAPKIARFYPRCPYSFFRASHSDLEILCSSVPFWVAEKEGQIVGFVFSSNYNQDYTWISGLAIPTRYDKSNVGRSLVGNLERHFHRSTQTIAVWETPRTKKWTGNLFLKPEYQPLCEIVAFEIQLPASGDNKRIVDSEQIRIATEKDEKLIRAIDAATFPPLFRYSPTAFNIMFKTALIRLLAINGGTGNPIGFLIANIFPSGLGNVARIAVLPDFRCKGVGAKLLMNCNVKMANRGVRLVTLNTQKDNEPSRALYHKLGFYQTNTETILGKQLNKTGEKSIMNGCMD